MNVRTAKTSETRSKSPIATQGQRSRKRSCGPFSGSKDLAQADPEAAEQEERQEGNGNHNPDCDGDALLEVHGIQFLHRPGRSCRCATIGGRLRPQASSTAPLSARRRGGRGCARSPSRCSSRSFRLRSSPGRSGATRGTTSGARPATPWSRRHRRGGRRPRPCSQSRADRRSRSRGWCRCSTPSLAATARRLFGSRTATRARTSSSAAGRFRADPRAWHGGRPSSRSERSRSGRSPLPYPVRR